MRVKETPERNTWIYRNYNVTGLRRTTNAQEADPEAEGRKYFFPSELKL